VNTPGSDAVAIVGLGAVFPGAADAGQFWRNIVAGVDATSEVPVSRWDPATFYDPRAYDRPPVADRFYCKRGGFVDDVASFDPTRFGIMPAVVESTDPDQLLTLRAAAEAIEDAGGVGALPDRARVGVVIGRGGYLTPGLARLDQRVRTVTQLLATLRELVPGLSDSQLGAVRHEFLAKLGPERPDAAIGLVPNFAASRVANRFDLHGPAYTVDAACASGLIAVDAAVHELTSGRCDAVLAGAVHVCHDPTLWSVFSQLRALSPSEQIRPFDRRADGTLMAEGTGVVLLKRYADAIRADDRVYATFRGVGVASDGRAASLISPAAGGQLLAVRRAWASAGVDPRASDALGLVEAHGTATPVGDSAELATLAEAFGTDGPSIGLGTVKSMIGHAMPAAGMAGLIKAALAVHHGILPPTLHVEEPHPALAATRCRLITEAAPWDGKGVRRAGVNAFGFGGINAHVVLEQASPATGRRTTTRSRPAAGEDAEPVLLLAADSRDGLAAQLAVPDADLFARAATADPPSGRCRLAVVAPTARRLALARKVVERGRPWRGREDIWFTAEPMLAAPGSLAFLFPGFEPEFAPHVDDVADCLGLDRPRLTGGDTLHTRGADVVAVGRLLADALGELGVTPDLVTGHSLGEWTAMVVAGCYRGEAVDRFVASLHPGTVQVPDVEYLVVGCSADRAVAIAGDLDVVVSHDNCPHQSVLCGPPAAVAAALDRLRAAGLSGELLSFRSGFHTPMATPYLEALRASFDVLPLDPPQVPIWSATTLEPYPDTPDEVRSLVIRHLLEPVLFRPLLERLHDTGIRGFVQVGPGSVTGFVADTLGRRDHLAIAAHVSGRSGLAQLRRVVAALWVEGRSPRWDRLRPAAPAGACVQLRLGAPMVSLDGAVPPLLLPAAPATLPANDHPILAALAAVLTDTTAAAQEVSEAWSAAPFSSAPTRVTVQDRPELVPAPPVLNEVRTVDCSLASMPWLIDHGLIPQAQDWPEPADRFLVVPMTGVLDLMADAARAVAPGRTVVGLEQVRVRRWLVVAPPTAATVQTIADGPDRVRVSVDGYASGTVLFAGGYPAPPARPAAPLRDEEPAPVDAKRLYSEGWMFHGPRYAGVSRIDVIADDGIDGELIALPAPGALLDAAGQLIGHWMQVRTHVDRVVFPIGVGEVRWYGPPPHAGQRLLCAVRITELTGERMTADAELRTEDGAVRVRITGWMTHRFSTDERMWDLKHHPDTAGAGEPQPEGWTLVRERWPDTATRELMMRRYLVAAERDEYADRSPMAQRQWLLGRVAVKDAVRELLWRRGAGPLFPAQIRVGNDTAGRPWARGPDGETYRVSLAHTGPVAVAMVGIDDEVGIDVEPVVDRPVDSVAAAAFTEVEKDLVRRAGPAGAAELVTRLWTAKEAAAKAAGSGLRGNPRRFAVTDLTGTGCTVTAEGQHWPVRHRRLAGPDQSYVVAWTTGARPDIQPEGRA
jgi:acyl transferase domain-containing protein/phosphopantetheinyl transferase